MDKKSKMIIGLLAASVAAIVVLLFIEKKATSSSIPTPSPTPSSTGLTPTQQPTPSPTPTPTQQPTPSPTPTPTPSSLPPSTLTPASNVFSYLNGLLQVSVKYQYPTYIGYKTQLPNGNQLLLLPVPQGTSQSGIACATLLDYDLLPYLISEVMAPTGGPYCQGFYNTFAIYNGFIVFDLPPPGAFVRFSLNASSVMPDVFAIAISTNNGTLAYVLQDITLPQNILSQLPIGAGYWSSSAYASVLGQAGAQYQFITLDSVISNGQPSAYEYWTYIPYPSQINNFYSGYPPPTSLLNAGYFFNLLNDLYIPVSQITQVTGVQAYNPGPIGVVYSPNAITQTSTNLNGYSYKYYTYDQLQAIWQQNEAPDTVTFYNFLGAIGIFSLNKVNTVIVSPRGTLSQLLQWAQQNKQINGYNALFPGPIPF